MKSSALSLAFLFALSTFPAFAADPEPAAADKAKLIAQLEKTLTGCKMTGKFTILGQDKEPEEDSYELVRAMKGDEGDIWLITAKMKDKTYPPIPVEIIWSGDTPVITLTNVTIPGMGAGFSCRIVIYDGLYAGTWGHGKTIGHMFGKIERAKMEEKK